MKGIISYKPLTNDNYERFLRASDKVDQVDEADFGATQDANAAQVNAYEHFQNVHYIKPSSTTSLPVAKALFKIEALAREPIQK